MGKGEQTRQAVLEQATEIASRLGLSGLTIGSLATSAGLSKSGVYAHFLSKEDLQLATVRHARDCFVDEVLRPALSAPRGEPRLRTFFERWLGRCREDAAPHCLYLAAKVEFGAQPGRVRDVLARDYQDLLDAIEQMVRAGIAEGQFRPDADPARFAQDLDGIVLSYFFANRLLRDPATEQRAWASFESALAGIRAVSPSGSRRE